MIPPSNAVQALLRSETAPGIALIIATIAALIIANSPAATAYSSLLSAYAGPLSVEHWINDGLMAIFFLLVGLEIKREFLEGELSEWSARILPGIAALCGIAVPAVIFIALNWGSPENLRGWAIPSATDIAFAIGILSLAGSSVPLVLKVLLTTIAVLDDIAAIIIIAVFYTASVSVPFLALAAGVLLVLYVLNRAGVSVLWPYLVAGAFLWFFVLKSGVHATVAGVALAAFIPLREKSARVLSSNPPLLRLEHALAPFVAFAVVPLFALANAGISFSGLTLAAFANPLTMGIAAGLFIGKQAGIMAGIWAAIRLGFAQLPAGTTWLQIYGMALLCGIGFTMSLFIGFLAFPGAEPLQQATKLGVLAGSLISAIAGFAVLKIAGQRLAAAQNKAA